MADARRELTFLLAEPERRLLRAVAARLPRRVTSDTLTAIGVAGAVLTGAAYALSSFSPWWLVAASLMLAVNWFGDSLDGTLARVRHHERPRYGYYLDHMVDAFATAAVGLGIGLSPWVGLETALVLVVGCLRLSINVYLESAVFEVFRISYGRVGPTEARILLVVVNTALMVVALAHGRSALVIAIANGVCLALAAGMLAVLVTRCAANLRRLAHLEPPPPFSGEAAARGTGA